MSAGGVCLSRTNLFVVGFSTFLISCIDYSKLTHAEGGVGRLGDVLVKQCIVRGGVAHWLFMVSVTAFFVFQLVTFATSLPKLFSLYQFYTHLIGVPDSDIQTLPWPEIVRRIAELKNENPITSLSNGQASALEEMVGKTGGSAKLDAHDIAKCVVGGAGLTPVGFCDRRTTSSRCLTRTYWTCAYASRCIL